MGTARDETLQGAARGARRPLRAWLSILGALAILSVVPVGWAQHDFGGREPYQLDCRPEPWSIDPAGLWAFILWWMLMALVVGFGWWVFRARRTQLGQDRKARLMLAVGSLLGLTPGALWVFFYMGTAIDCGM